MGQQMKTKLSSVRFIGKLDSDNLVPWLHNEVPTVPIDLLKSHPYSDRMVILQRPVVAMVIYEEPDVIVTVTADAGYAFDHASVPRSLSNIVQYDDPALSKGAFIHDICFNHEIGGLDFSASILRDVALYFGYNKRKTNLVHFAVKTNIARRLYNKRDEFDKANCAFSHIRLEA